MNLGLVELYVKLDGLVSTEQACREQGLIEKADEKEGKIREIREAITVLEGHFKNDCFLNESGNS